MPKLTSNWTTSARENERILFFMIRSTAVGETHRSRTHRDLRFNRTSCSQCIRRRQVVISPKCPGTCAAHQRLMIVQSTYQCRNCRRRRPIAEHNCGVSQESPSPRPPQRSIAKPLAKRSFIQFEQLDQVHRVTIRARLKFRLLDSAAHANSKDKLSWHTSHPNTHSPIPVRSSARYRIAQLDREITDAPRRIEHVGLRKRIRRTSIQASSTRPAMIGLMRRVVRQFNVGQQRSQKEPAAFVAIEQQRVLSNPTQASELSKLSLQQRGRIHDAAHARLRHTIAQ